MADEPSWAPIDSGPEVGVEPRRAAGAAPDTSGPASSHQGEEGPLGMHPMSLPEVLDGAFTLLKTNVATLVLVCGAFLIPVQVLTSFLRRDLLGGRGLLDVLSDPSTAQAALSSAGSGAGAASALLLSVASRVFVVPAVAGAVCVIAGASFRGVPVDAATALKVAARRWWSLVVAWILVHMVEGLASVFFVVPGLLAVALFVPVAPVIVLEGVGALRAMRRSASLVGSRVLPVLGIAVTSAILAGAVSTALGIVPQTAAYLVGLERGWVLLAAGSTVTSLITTPFVAIVATLVYLDARIRREGLDLAVMADRLTGAAVER